MKLKEGKGQRRAVLIRIDQYHLDPAISNLNFCVNDVIELNSILSDPQRGGYDTILLHSGMGDNKLIPNRSNILSTINLLAKNSEEEDSILVYFAGHGYEKEKISYLLPADSVFDILHETAIQLKWVKQTLDNSQARKKFLIIDACHAGSNIGRATPSLMSQPFEEELFAESEGFAIMSSCKIDQLSYEFEEKKHGVFSYYLLEGLMGPADLNKDGIITIPDANQFVSQRIRKWCIKYSHVQNPTLSYKVSGDFILVRVPKENDKRKETPIKITKKTEKDEDMEIKNQIEDIRLMSYEDMEIDENYHFECLDYRMDDKNLNQKNKKSKIVIDEVATKRFSSKLVRQEMVKLIVKLLDSKEIKKWIKNKRKVKSFLIQEFISSDSFEYAGITAKAIEELLPIFLDEEIKEIVTNIKGNTQITSSFKARSSLISIVESARSTLPYNEYIELRKSIFGV